MKRAALIVALTIVATILGMAPAQAGWYERVDRTFTGPDGAGGANVIVGLSLEDNDFSANVRGYASFANNGTKKAVVHVSYLDLVRNGDTVRHVGSFVITLFPGDLQAAATAWYLNPSGSFHSRLRMWVCWPFTGTCGDVVVWNSGTVTY